MGPITLSITAEDKVYQAIKGLSYDRCARELLMFLGRHPHARFTRLILISAFDAPKLDIDKALTTLTNRGLIKTCQENTVSLYWLTEAEPANSLIRSMAVIDCRNGRTWANGSTSA